MSIKFAKGLTKEYLIKAGVKDIYFNPYDLQYHVIGKNDKEKSLFRNDKGYLHFNIYALNEQGQYIKKPIRRKHKGCKKVSDTYRYKSTTINLHRAIYAWFKGDIPQGIVVDHIDNKHETHYDNRPENLQLLTPAENVAKEKGNYKQLVQRASDLKELRKNINEAHEAYTKNKTPDNRYIWKLSIENWKKYLELHPFKKLENIETELFDDSSSEQKQN